MIEPGARMVCLIIAVILALLSSPVPGIGIGSRVSLLSLAIAFFAAAFLFP